MAGKAGVFEISEGQAELLDYWQTHRRPCGCAPRARINPGEVRGLLGNISVIEIAKDGSSKFRLAGSRLRDIVGAEARGRSVSEIQGGELEPWCDAILSVLDSRRPVAGVTELTDRGLLHVWLRLPLLDNKGGFTQIMCHDELVNASKPGLVKRKVETEVQYMVGAQAA